MKPRFFLLPLILIVILVGCSDDTKGDGGNENLQLWHSLSGEKGEKMDELIERFNDAHSDIQVEATFQGAYDEMSTKIYQSIPSGTEPDLTLMERGYVSTFEENEVLEDLSEYIEESDLELDDFVSGLMDDSVFGDRVATIPFNRSTPILYVNKDLLDDLGLEIPENLDDLEEVANEMTEKEDGETTRYGFAMPHNNWFMWWMVYSYGDNIFNEDKTSFDFTDDDVGYKSFKFLKDLQDSGTMYYPPSEDSGSHVQKQFFSEKTGMIIESTAALGELTERSDFDVETAFMPEIEGNLAVPTGGANIGMLNTTDKKDAAWEFIEWITTEDEGVAQFLVDTGYMPFTKQMTDSEPIQDLWSENPNYETAFKQLEYAQDKNAHPQWEPLKSEFESTMGEIFYDDEDIKDALSKYKKVGEEIMEDEAEE